MQIEKISISALKPYERNAKLHPKEQIEQIKKSIEKYGNNDPIAVWGKDNIIVEGHGRLMALKELGVKEVEIIRLDHLTSKQRREYMLVHNKLTMNTDFDFDILDEELADLDFDGFDFGFEMDTEFLPEEIIEDEVPEPPAEPKAKLGDLYQLGGHRLICGDSTDSAVIDRLMDGHRADISFTSPPYNVGDSAVLNGTTHMTECKYQSGNDNLSDYDELLMGSTDNMLMFSKWAFINLQMLANNKIVVCEWLDKYKDVLCDIAIWYKTATAPAMAERVMNSQYEFVFIFSNENNSRAIGTKQFRGTVSNVYEGSAQRKNEYASVHSATFPMEFVSHFISNFTNKGDSVLDVFGGTGTTMSACEQLGRRCFMAEIDPLYCDVIIERWENLTGQKAVLLNG